jgi:hypothetical protein
MKTSCLLVIIFVVTSPVMVAMVPLKKHIAIISCFFVGSALNMFRLDCLQM